MSWTRKEKLTLVFSIIGGPLVTLIFDVLREKPILSTFLLIISTIYHYTILFLNIELRVWWILIGIIVIVLILGYFLGKNDQQVFNFLQYKEDKFDDYNWSWDYELNPDTNKWDIINLRARCPECNTTMRPKSVFLDTITECPRGDFSINGNIYGDTDRIKLLIHDNLERELKRVLEETNQT